MYPTAAGSRPLRALAGPSAAVQSSQTLPSKRSTHRGADRDSRGAEPGEKGGLVLEWVNITADCRYPGTTPLFTPRCAHAMTLLPGTPASGLPSTVGVVGGCNELSYFHAEEVRLSPPARCPLPSALVPLCPRVDAHMSAARSSPCSPLCALVAARLV